MQKVTYIYSGETQTFYFNFPYFEKSNIVVTVDNQPAPAYNVIGVKGGTDADYPFISGKIVFEKPLKKFQTITIARNLPYTRPIDFQPSAQITPIALNQDMNYTIELLKDLHDDICDFRDKYTDIVDKDSTNLLLEKIALVNQNISAISEYTDVLDNVPGIQNDIESLENTINSFNSDLENCINSITTLNTKTENISDYVIESQMPTAENNYTWYRKYKSGWIEQGGSYGGSQNQVISLPLEMADNNYSVMLSFNTTSINAPVYSSYAYDNRTTVSFKVINSGSIYGMWEVKGLRA